MEHRLGTRHSIDLAVHLQTWGSKVWAKGRLRDLSVSGAFIETELPCRPLLHLCVQISPSSRSRQDHASIEGTIVRVTDSGIGIEWGELTPELVARFIFAERGERGSETMRTAQSVCM
jgi:hypothetical protein